MSEQPEKPALENRLAQLKKDLRMAPGQEDASDARQKNRDDRAQQRARGLAQMGRVVSELVAGPLVGGFIGWWLDRLLSSSPLCLIIFFILGLAAGFWNVYRMAVVSRSSSGGAVTDDVDTGFYDRE